MNEEASKQLDKPIAALALIFVASSALCLGFVRWHRIIICAFFVLAAIFAACFLHRGKKLLAAVFALAVILSCVIPVFSYNSTEKRAEEFVSVLGAKPHEFSGKVISCTLSGNYAKFDISLLSVDGQNLSEKFKTQIDCFSGDFAKSGDIVTFSGTAQGLENTESDDFDTKSYLRSRKIFINIPRVTVISTSKSGSMSLFEKVRGYLHDAVYEFLPKDYDYTTSAVAAALSYGDKSAIPKSVKLSFVRSGLTHILCVSGMHLSIILGFVSLLLEKLTVDKRVRCGAVMLLCVFYVVLTGFSASVIRSGIMALVTYTALLTGRRHDSANSLFFAAILMCVFDPYVVFSPSAQLSFLSTFGIISSIGISEKLSNFRLFSNRFVNFLARSLLLNISAVAFTLPVSAYSFGGFSVVSFLSTVLVSYQCQIVLVMLMCIFAMSPFGILRPFCVTLGSISDLLLKSVIWVSNLFSSFKFSYVPCSETLGFLVAFLVLIIMLTLFMTFSGKSVAVYAFKLSVISLGVVLCAVSLFFAFKADSVYKVSYYRKNVSDRQLDIKLGRHGALIFNADSVLCTNSSKAYFDVYSGNNLLVVLPDEELDCEILSHNIKSFDKRFGIKQVYVPDTPDGERLSDELYSFGINSALLPDRLCFGKLCVYFDHPSDASFRVLADDGRTRTLSVFAPSYDKAYFNGRFDVCAFFTRETENQFDAASDVLPDCESFFTRLGRGETAEKTVNTFGKTSVMIKE